MLAFSFLHSFVYVYVYFSLFTYGVNFINILQVALTYSDPKSAKETVKLSVFFMLLRSARAKAVRRTLMNMTTDVDNLLVNDHLEK
jgi:hypothetical protein